ncbi:MAG: HAD-IC family P-type ATPase [Acholeplasmataceae bacterium]|nr:HAD-IC family P-type ATPase [Acholeplasmataceae bacterium]MCK9233701.1 HAD-IC family P-type ATPase [Acholeplasmataceae bacterium]MCK9288828.1 HAD-IC family P-type ATPase [Acholeplasmataceae bacterium]MCK9427266.1 HAD-IC family P-type ATPase [Acholeplasmataceae bacterium]
MEATRKEQIILHPPSLKEGLTKEDVNIRKQLNYVNKTAKGSSKTVLGIILTNIFTFFNIVNISIAAMLISIQSYKHLFFMIIITLNTVIGIFQEIKAKKTIDRLSLISNPKALVLREGEKEEIAIDEVVLNDLIFLKIGNQIIADCIVREGFVEVDESLLTGESDPIGKQKGDKLLSGSYVVSGNCLAEAVKVGKDAYVESLTKKAKQYKKPNSDLIKSLKIIITTIGIFIIPVGIGLFFVQYNQGINYPTAIEKTAGAMIGMMPSGLFLLTSVALAVGVIRLAQNNTLVQELYCIETLARVDTLCLDKTGTITDGTMEVKETIFLSEDKKYHPDKIIPHLMAYLEDNNQTSLALVEKFGISKRPRKANKVVSFSSQRKYTAVEFNQLGTFALGAPEFILWQGNYLDIKKEVEKEARKGYRVLLLAHSEEALTNEKLPKMTPLAFVLLEDTVRNDAIATIEYFNTHNVDVRVISGDNALTVSQIAKRAGVPNADKYISLENLDDKEVVESASKYQIFGRVSPEQKKLLIQALKASGKTVAMTGDGVNDILALKEADASIALASGSEAARNASHLVLLDSNFSSMPKVVGEGRRVINNIQRVATLFLTKTIFSVLLTMVAFFVTKEYPISPVQLFLIDFLVIGMPSFLLSLQVNNEQIKGRFLSNVMKKALPGALTVAFQTLIIYFLKTKLNMTDAESSTLIVISATFTGFVVLYRVIQPLTTYKRILLFVTLLLFIAAIVFIPTVFNFNPLFKFYLSTKNNDFNQLGVELFLLLIVMVQSAPLLITFFVKLPSWIARGVKAAIMKLSGV